MTLDDFAQVTRNVIARNGFDDFQPSACFPDQKTIRSLAGFPADEEPEGPVVEWARSIARPGEELLVAFRVSANQFKAIRFANGMREEQVYVV